MFPSVETKLVVTAEAEGERVDMRCCSGVCTLLLLGTVHGFSRSSILLQQRASTYQSAGAPRTLRLDKNKALRPRQSSLLMTTSTSTSFDDGEIESTKGTSSTPTVVSRFMRFIYKCIAKNIVALMAAVDHAKPSLRPA